MQSSCLSPCPSHGNGHATTVESEEVEQLFVIVIVKDERKLAKDRDIEKRPCICTSLADYVSKVVFDLDREKNHDGAIESDSELLIRLPHSVRLGEFCDSVHSIKLQWPRIHNAIASVVIVDSEGQLTIVIATGNMFVECTTALVETLVEKVGESFVGAFLIRECDLDFVLFLLLRILLGLLRGILRFGVGLGTKALGILKVSATLRRALSETLLMRTLYRDMWSISVSFDGLTPASRVLNEKALAKCGALSCHFARAKS
jgi:hypothetical protein